VGAAPARADWTEAMATLLPSAQDKAAAARDKGKTSLSPQPLRRISKAYDEIVTQAIRANPDPLLLGRQERTKAERDSFNLALAFKDVKAAISRFCENLAVGFRNDTADRE